MKENLNLKCEAMMKFSEEFQYELEKEIEN